MIKTSTASVHASMLRFLFATIPLIYPPIDGALFYRIMGIIIVIQNVYNIEGNDRDEPNECHKS